jgi:hypothetical protein
MSLTRTGWLRSDPSRGASVGEVRALSLVPSAQPAGVDQESWSCRIIRIAQAGGSRVQHPDCTNCPAGHLRRSFSAREVPALSINTVAGLSKSEGPVACGLTVSS